MVRMALAFVFGAFFLQQQPMLPSLYWAVLPLGILIFYLALPHLSSVGARFSCVRYLHMAAARSSLAVITAFLLGFFWAAIFAYIRMSDELPHQLQNQTITLVGVVASSVEHLERGERFRFDVEQVLTQDARVPRHISLSYYPPERQGFNAGLATVKSTKFKVAERWQIVVKLKRPHGTQNPHGYDFEAWALTENIRATGTIKTKAQHQKLQSFVWRPKYVVEYLRDRVKQRIASVLPGRPYSGVLQALVMGDDAAIVADDWQLFLRTGTTHLMSISGLHITMLSGLAYVLTSIFWRRSPSLIMRFPARKAATCVGLVVALMYVLLAGFAVPAQRTFYMLLVFACALWSGRQVPISHVLSLALLTVTVLDPWAVMSAGFWLSFAAVAVLAYAFAGRVATVGWLKTAAYSQWVVTLGMLPLLLFMFHQASVISPIANAFAIPLISFVVTPLALMGSFLPIDSVLELAHFALEICMRLLGWLNHLPSVVWQQHAPPVWTLLPAVAGVIWVLLPSGFPLRSLGFVGLLPMFLALPKPIAQGDMKVAVLDVGQGLSVVVQTANHTLLYDAGPKSSTQSDAAKRVILPFLQGEGVAKLDMLMLSHDDIDHAGGVQTLLTHLPVERFSSSLNPESVMAYSPLENHPSLQHHDCEAGQHWVWDGVNFDVLHPASLPSSTSDNNRSCVLRVSSATGSLLLTGDIEKLAEQQILSREIKGSASLRLKADVLVAPHHGSKTSSSDGFVTAVAPNLTVFTNGYLNRFRHPHPAVVSRYETIGSQVLRSDYDGAVLLQFEVAESVHSTSNATSDPTSNSASQPAYQVMCWRQYHQRYWHDLYS